MVFEDISYSILIVSSSEKITASLTSLLPRYRFDPVTCVASLSEAKSELSDHNFDLIIVNSPLIDGFGTEFAIDASHLHNAVVLQLVKAEIAEEVSTKVRDYGIYTLSKPTSAQIIEISLNWMMTTREKLRQIEKKTTKLEDKMEEIRTVNHAKWLLIENLKMTEQDAHRYIEKQAMDRCITKQMVAESIIKTYS